MSFSNHHNFGCAARRVRPACLVAAALLCGASASLAITLPQRSHVTGGKPDTAKVAARPKASTTAARPASHRPYLARIGPSPLRFAAALPERTDPPAPPVLTKPEELKPEPAIEPTEPAAPLPPAPAPVAETKAPPPAPVPTTEPKPLNILPDDTRLAVRPEDVLPFFQLPRSGADATIGVAVPFNPATPAAPALPPSSATYQQK